MNKKIFFESVENGTLAESIEHLMKFAPQSLKAYLKRTEGSDDSVPVGLNVHINDAESKVCATWIGNREIVLDIEKDATPEDTIAAWAMIMKIVEDNETAVVTCFNGENGKSYFITHSDPYKEWEDNKNGIYYLDDMRAMIPESCICETVDVTVNCYYMFNGREKMQEVALQIAGSVFDRMVELSTESHPGKTDFEYMKEMAYHEYLQSGDWAIEYVEKTLMGKGILGVKPYLKEFPEAVRGEK